MAQLELQQKSLQAQNEILSKVGWAAASHMGGSPDLSLAIINICPARGLQSFPPVSLWTGIILSGRQLYSACCREWLGACAGWHSQPSQEGPASKDMLCPSTQL